MNAHTNIPTDLIEAHRVNEVAKLRALQYSSEQYEKCKASCYRLTPFEMAALAQWLIDQLEHNHITAGGRVNIEDLKIEADAVIGEIVETLK